MALETAKHFDAPQPPTAFQAGARLVADRWVAFLALVVVLAVTFVAAAGVSAFEALAHAGRDAAVRATTAAVVLETQTTPADAESVGAQIRSIPGVADATFRSKDDALKDLSARGLPQPEGRNPLPDVWLLRIRADEGGTAPGTRLSTAAKAAGALPHVAAVRYDAGWASRLDHDEASRRELVEPALKAMLAALSIVAAALGLLSGGALQSGESVRKSALALVVGCALLVGTALAYAVVVAVGALQENRMVQSGVEVTGASWTAALPTHRPLELGALWGAGALLVLVGALMSGRSGR